MHLSFPDQCIGINSWLLSFLFFIIKFEISAIYASYILNLAQSCN